MIEDDEPEEVPETTIDVEIPKITTNLGKHIHFVKLPNFLSVDTRYVNNNYNHFINNNNNNGRNLAVF